MMQPPKDSPSDSYAAGYRQWKEWNRLFTYSAHQSTYFTNEFAGIELDGARVLEIGFGAGSFLSWAKSRGAQLTGCELIESVCAIGVESGYDTRYGDIRHTIDPESEKFDLVVAFDVLEHIPSSDTLDFLGFILHTMNPGGLLFVRVPNGQSPFGLINQYGDITHVQVLSKGRFEQIAAALNLELVFCRNECRVGQSKVKLLDTARFAVRDLINRVMRSVYLLGDIPFDQNIVACFRKLN